MKLCSYVRVLPFGSLTSPKSMVTLDNLCDLIVHCLYTPLATRNIFVVSDDATWSTKDLIALIAKFLNIRVFNIPIPPGILGFLAMLFGRSDDISKLTSTLTVDNSNTKEVLGWSPCQEPIVGLQQAVEYFKCRI